MKKKVLAIVLCLAVVTALVFGLVACNNDADAKELELPAFEGIANPDYSKVEIKKDFKIGIICLHDDSSTYDKNFIDAAKKLLMSLVSAPKRTLSSKPTSKKMQNARPQHKNSLKQVATLSLQTPLAMSNS